MNDPIWVIVPAAGSGVRAGLDVPKQFSMLGGVSVLERTVSTLLGIPAVAGVVVALPPYGGGSYVEGHVMRARSSIATLSRQDRPIVFVDGGRSRQESVYNGLVAVPEHVPWIAVHDACRPFCSKTLFERVAQAARHHGAAIPGLVPTDTVKIASRETEAVSRLDQDLRFPMSVAQTLDRGSLINVQTPQVFSSQVLREAYLAAFKEGFVGTDDSQLVERLGLKVVVVEGERSNLKLTYPEDFALAKVLLDGESTLAPKLVVGLGFDIHPLVPGRTCILGGVRFDFEKGPAGHSDADVLCHAMMDGVLGALGKGDIGQWFPDTDPRYEGASSIGLMKEMWNAVKSEAEVVNVDAVIVAEAPKIMPKAMEIRENLADALNCDAGKISVKATTAEGLGTVGRGEGIAAFCVVTLKRL